MNSFIFSLLKWILIPVLFFSAIIALINHNEYENYQKEKEIALEELSIYGKSFEKLKQNLDIENTYIHYQEPRFDNILQTTAGLQNRFNSHENHIFVSSNYDFGIVDITENNGIFTYLFTNREYGYDNYFEVTCDENLMSYMLAATKLYYDEYLLIVHSKPVSIVKDDLGDGYQDGFTRVINKCDDYLIVDSEYFVELLNYLRN